MRKDLHPLGAAHLALTQELKQRFTVQQSERGLLEGGDLRVAHGAIGQLAHQARVLILPLLPDDGALEYAARDQLFVAVAAAQGGLNSIGGFAHEASVADRMAQHFFLLLARFC
jgi:hypothetical protein